MADWRDVTEAQTDARAAARELVAYMETLPEGPVARETYAHALATLAICAELRALGTMLDYAVGGVARAASGRRA